LIMSGRSSSYAAAVAASVAASVPSAPSSSTSGGQSAPIPPFLAFLGDYPGLFAELLLPRLDPGDRAVLAQVAHPLLAAVSSAAAAVDSDLPRAGKSAGVPLKLLEFFGSAERLAWGKSNGCPWIAATCQLLAKHGQLEALQWARELECPWDARVCACAAAGGHLMTLKWLRQHGCPW